METLPFILAGAFIQNEKIIEVKNPFDGNTEFLVSSAEAESIEMAIAHSELAAQRTKAIPSFQKYKILHDIAEEIRNQKEELAQIIRKEAGKPIRFARAEVDRAIITFTLAADLVRNWKGEILPLDLEEKHIGKMGLVKRFPIGTVLAISPFNFPLNLVAHKVAPAIAAGNPIIIKPASQTPVSALKLAEIIIQTDWPSEAISVLPCQRELAQKMVEDDRIKKLTFTGSPDVGWALKAAAGKKKVTLELGGDSAAIIDESANLEDAAIKVAMGAFAYAGQVCISVQRILVHEKIYTVFSDALEKAVNKITFGDPEADETLVGPMIDSENKDRIINWVKEAISEGAKLKMGKLAANGNVIAPMILEAVSPNSKISHTEVFGPVANLIPFKDLEEAFSIVNASKYGLQAGIFTDSHEAIKQAFNELEVGGVIVNNVPTLRVDNMPYGGIKDSGFGREGLEYAIRDMTELKVLVW